MGVAVGALTVVVVLLAILVAGLLRSHAEILRALHDAGVSLAPDAQATGETTPAARRLAIPGRPATAPTEDSLTGTDPAGDPVVIALAGRGPTLVAFLTSSCLTCREFWTAFAAPRLELPQTIRLVIVTKGADEEQPEAVARLAPPRVPVVMSSDAWSTLGVPVAPYFVLFGDDGRVMGEGAAATWPSVQNLLRQSLADTAHAAGIGADPSVEDDDEVLRHAGIAADHRSLRPTPHEAPDR